MWTLLILTILSLAATSGFAADTATKKAPNAKASATKTSGAKATRPEMIPIQDELGLPRVLLIGDSISMGYTLPTRELLKGKANVHRIPTNGGPTTTGLKEIEKWLGNGKWDLIHFNWGLHDLKYMDDAGGRIDPDKGKIQVPLADYEKNLRQLTQRLKQTGAKLIWCTTTPVPEGSAARIAGDEVKYNAVAAKIMAEEGIAIHDLGAFAKEKMASIGLPANVHYSPNGYRELATRVAATIEASLSAKK
jgi:lysophospholipase L1-like esterase